MHGIATPISGQFWAPVGHVAFRHSCNRAIATVVVMPEAAVHEDNFLVARENQIGLSWKDTYVEAVAKTHRKNEPPYSQFRRHTFTTDAAHIFAASSAADRIHAVTKRRSVQ